MRIEPFFEGHVVHVIKRGARNQDIFIDDSDRWQFVKSIFILNDTYHSLNWRRETANLPMYERPKTWPERNTLTNILAWTILPNHIHLLLQEKSKGGISKFIQRVSGSMTLGFNLKYQNQGSIFQGSYKAKRVNDNDYLNYVLFYIMIKNVFEMYPGGLKVALSEFDRSWNWALTYPFSSLGSCLLKNSSPILCDPDNLLSNVIDGGGFSKEEVFKILTEYENKNQNSDD